MNYLAKFKELKKHIEFNTLVITSNLNELIQKLEQDELCKTCEGYTKPLCEKVYCVRDKARISQKLSMPQIAMGDLAQIRDISGDRERTLTSKRQIRDIEKREGLIFGGDDVQQEIVHKKKTRQKESDIKARKTAENIVRTVKERSNAL